MSETLEKFEKKKMLLTKNKELAESRLQSALAKHQELQTSDIDKKETRLEISMKNISVRKHALELLEDKLEFLRPENPDDIAYRNRQYEEFPKKIKEIVPDNLPLRFHGCPIYAAKKIIHDGEISSSADRLGYETSFDSEGQISVTTKQTIETTIWGYTDLGGDYNIPAGCVFVLLPKDENDAKAGDSMLMENVSFKENPDRLFAIITSSENIENIKKWSQESGIDISKIHDFDGFIQNFDKLKNSGKYINLSDSQKDSEAIFTSTDIGKAFGGRNLDRKLSAETHLLGDKKTVVAEKDVQISE